MKILSRNDISLEKDAATVPLSLKVCMYVLGRARTDIRVMRAATALLEAGFAVSLIDIECESRQPIEDTCGVNVKHIITPGWYTSRRFKLWFLIRALQVFIRSTL